MATSEATVVSTEAVVATEANIAVVNEVATGETSSVMLTMILRLCWTLISLVSTEVVVVEATRVVASIAAVAIATSSLAIPRAKATERLARSLSWTSLSSSELGAQSIFTVGLNHQIKPH